MTDMQKARILLVDDEPYVSELLSRWLALEGYSCNVASSAEGALELLHSRPYELLVSDIMMPGMSGIDLLKIVRASFPDLAVIMVTAVDDRKTAVKMLELGAYGYVIKPFDRNEILIGVANALERRRVTLLMREYEHSLEQKVLERTAQVRQREEQIVFRLVSASEYRDSETGAHIRRIGLYSSVIARELAWGPEEINEIRLAAPMHDVGKIGIPDRVLQKPGKLTPEEFEIMKRHTEIGGRILDHPDIPLLRMAKEIALSHHEKWDGSGYPYGLAGKAIPLSARIVAIADVYDALCHDRVYKPAWPEDKAVSLLISEKGKHFDPEIVETFLRVLPEMRRIREEVKEESNPIPHSDQGNVTQNTGESVVASGSRN